MGVLVLRLQLGCARVIAVALAITAGCIALPGAALADTSYSVGTPIVDTIANGPWTTSQPDTAFGQTQYPLSDLLPTYTPQAPNNNTPLTNVAVYPASSSTSTPYPSGVAGTPGPLDGYCASGGPEPESGGPVPEPSGVNEPFAPYYFPDVVRNSDGSLTGYFDYRPKDADEEITVATSTDNGQTWTTEGQALEQNPSYCPVADTNDDGEGHPYVTSVGGTSRLYTLERAAGDNAGVGLLVHHVDPTAADPLSGVPATERSGVDPDTFASSGVSVPTGGGTTIPVSTLGTSGTINSIVAGPYEDADAADPSASVITCTGTSSSPSPELTGCTVAGASALSVSSGDELLQVIATAGNPKNPAPFTVPASSAQNPSGTGGLANLGLTNANATVSPFLLYTLNLNAPNRIYVDGHAVYCTQANADPTTKLEDCTSPDGPITVNSGDPITADPITPATAQMTTGLIAPDGIVGTLPSYPGAPGGSTVVVYTEKKLGYYLEGQVNGYVSGSPAAFSATAPTLGTSTGATINYSSFPSESEPLPSTGSFTVYFGTSTSSPIQAVTCTGWTTSVPAGAPAGSTDLTGCTGGTGTVAIGNWVGAPNAAIAPYSALGQVGEGTDSSSKGPEKLFGNNEDLTVLRVAYTTNGVDFTDLGAISGSSSGSGATNGGYNDVSNPNQQYSPDSSADPTTATINPSSPANLSSGSSDQIELRYIGSRGTIVTNPDGTLGMFLSGAWASDGDSDAFNQIFYTSSSDGGQTWSVPTVVLSTDYTFSASYQQENALAHGSDQPLGVSAYDSGRAYGPAVVQNTNGSLTMVFSGYRLPKPIEAAGTLVGTNSSQQYDVEDTDPALYRNILTAHLSSTTSPRVGTTSALTSSQSPVYDGTQVQYVDTVGVNSPGTGIPTGTVDFYDGGNPISGCQNVTLSDTTTDTADCQETPPDGSDSITAVYSGDGNYATSTGSLDQQVNPPGAPTVTITTPANGATFQEGQVVDANYMCDDGAGGPGIATCTDSQGVGSGNPIDTSAPGSKAFTVTATSQDGQQTSVTDDYTVQAGPVQNTTPPTVSGTLVDGHTLRADNGKWTSPSKLSYTHQWELCTTSNVSSCSPIATKAKADTYRLTSADVGEYLTVVVTATDKSGDSGSATATPVGPVADPPAPSNTAPPKIKGTLVVGHTVTGTLGTWSSADHLTYTHQWDLCTSPMESSCSPINDATKTTYKLTSADAGSYLGFSVTATDEEEQSTTAPTVTSGTVQIGAGAVADAGRRLAALLGSTIPSSRRDIRMAAAF
jgi:hypothetical protein